MSSYTEVVILFMLWPPEGFYGFLVRIPVHGTIDSTTNFCSGFFIQISHFHRQIRVESIVPCTGIACLLNFSSTVCPPWKCRSKPWFKFSFKLPSSAMNKPWLTPFLKRAYGSNRVFGKNVKEI